MALTAAASGATDLEAVAVKSLLDDREDVDADEGSCQQEAVGLEVAELQDQAVDAANLLKSMSNESRLLILCNLAEGEKSVGELQSLVELSQSALSQHLAVLRRDGLVATRRSAQSIYYRVKSEPAQAIMATLYTHFCGNGTEDAS